MHQKYPISNILKIFAHVTFCQSPTFCITWIYLPSVMINTMISRQYDWPEQKVANSMFIFTTFIRCYSWIFYCWQFCSFVKAIHAKFMWLITVYAICMHTEIRYYFTLMFFCHQSSYRNTSGSSFTNPYPEPVYTGWSSVHWNATGMPLVDPVYTGIPLGAPANTCRVHWNTTGKT